MIRFLLRLFGITDFEPCKGCEVLKTQLEIANQERADLLSTIMSLVKPEVIQSSPTVIKPVISKGIPWGIRKKGLEEKDREEMRIKLEQDALNSRLNRPNETITNLEKELGVEDASEIGQTV